MHPNPSAPQGRDAILIVDNPLSASTVCKRLLTLDPTLFVDTGRSESDLLEFLLHLTARDELRLILINSKTPTCDSIAFLRAVRASSRALTPVVMMAEDPDPSEITAALDAGATAFISVPTTDEDFKTLIDFWVRHNLVETPEGWQRAVDLGYFRRL